MQYANTIKNELATHVSIFVVKIADEKNMKAVLNVTGFIFCFNVFMRPRRQFFSNVGTISCLPGL